MKAIPLTPVGGGGICLADSALQAADITVSAGTGLVSDGIRLGTSSDVSHASLYAGDGNVVEAIGEGVVQRSLAKALDEDYLAVAYRVRGMTPSTAARIVHVAAQWKGKKYDTPGALEAGARSPVLCVIVACGAARAGAFKSSDKFYCSQLVLEAYRQAGASFVTQDPNLSQPQDVVTAYSKGKLLYVGHLDSGEQDRRRT
jgi:cell wall-associated NlpC family hydrolase